LVSDFSINNFEGSGVGINSGFGGVDSIPTDNEESFESDDCVSFTGVKVSKGFFEVIE